MSDLYELTAAPKLIDPPLVVVLDGWVDAGSSARQAIDVLREQCDVETIAEFDCDRLLDHRAHRPIMHLVDGVNTGLSWPRLALEAATDARGREFLLLDGPEPDHEWRSFAGAVVSLCHEFEVTQVVGLGAYPAAAPHTRDTSLTATASTQQLADAYDFVNATLDVPAGMQAVIERLAGDEGIPSIGLWAQVPHYASGMHYPLASAALLDRLRRLTGISCDATELHAEAVKARSRLDQLIQQDPDHVEMLEKLEAHVDALAETRDIEIPSGDELAEQLEAFLRESEGDET